jgi:hypothetical protein
VKGSALGGGVPDKQEPRRKSNFSTIVDCFVDETANTPFLELFSACPRLWITAEPRVEDERSSKKPEQGNGSDLVAGH